MPEQQKPMSRVDAALMEQRAIIEILTTRCCQHAADTSAAINERDAALATISDRDKRVAELESEIDALKPAPVEQPKV